MVASCLCLRKPGADSRGIWIARSHQSTSYCTQAGSPALGDHYRERSPRMVQLLNSKSFRNQALFSVARDVLSTPISVVPIRHRDLEHKQRRGVWCELGESRTTESGDPRHKCRTGSLRGIKSWIEPNLNPIALNTDLRQLTFKTYRRRNSWLRFTSASASVH